MPSLALTPQNAGAYHVELERRLNAIAAGTSVPATVLEAIERLRTRLPDARKQLNALAGRLQAIAAEADRLIREMDFASLFDRRRKLLSVGYNVSSKQLNKSCYDLL